MEKKPQKKRWSMLAYIAADSNLSEEGLEDIKEMCAVGASSVASVGVEIDTLGHEGSIRYEITEPDWTEQAYRTIIEELPEQDSGRVQSLANFLAWGVERYPSDKRLVVVWNHGTGFRAPSRDIAYDDYGSSLDMPEIIAAFNAAGIGETNRVSLVGFDACLMNMLEVAHHLSSVAEILVGSQEVEPFNGWPYDQVLNAINGDPEPVTLSEQIVKVYIQSYGSIPPFGITQSAIDLSKTAQVNQDLHRVGNALTELLKNHRSDVLAARDRTQAYEYSDYVDLVAMADCLSNRIKDESLRTDCEALKESVRKAVIATASKGYMVKRSHGLSCWYPRMASTYLDYRSKYVVLRDCGNESGWVRFLDALHA